MAQDSTDTARSVLSGQITDPNGDTVPGVNIRVYPYNAGAGATPLETESNDAGEYSFDTLEDQETRDEYINNPDSSVIIATIGDWFWASSVNLESDTDLVVDITLRNQILRSPTAAYDSGVVSSGTPSLITCWRRIEDPGIQTLFLEVTDLYKHAVNSEDYEILDYNSTDTLNSGTFLTSNLRDKANINFGTRTDVGNDDTPKAQIKAIPAFEDNSELEKWHPIRTNIPIFDISNNHRQISTMYSEPNANTEWARVQEGIGLIASGLPYVGQALAIADLTNFIFGEEFEDSAEIGNTDTGYPNLSEDDNLDLPDPNTHINTTLSWSAEGTEFAIDKAGSVVLMIPLEFNEGIHTVEVTAQAEWLHTLSHVEFGQLFELSRFDSIVPDGYHPSGVSNDVWNAVTGQNDPTDELTYDDLVDSIQAYQNDESIDGISLTREQLQDLISYYEGGI